MNNNFHIGQKIREVMREKQFTATLLAEKIHTTRTNMHKIMRKSNLDIELLIRISVALEHDFFADISQSINIRSV